MTVRAEEEEIFHGRIHSRYDIFQKLLDHFKVAYEAGPCGFWLHDRLREDGVEVIVAPSFLIPIESGNKVKMDKRDSRKLARLLEGNMLKRVWVLTEEDRVDRELLRTRRQMVEHRNYVARQIKSKLLFYGIPSPFSARDGWSQNYLGWLKGLELQGEVLKVCFESLIELYEYLTEQLIKLKQKVKELPQSLKYRERVRLLGTVPGIGTLLEKKVVSMAGVPVKKCPFLGSKRCYLNIKS